MGIVLFFPRNDGVGAGTGFGDHLLEFFPLELRADDCDVAVRFNQSATETLGRVPDQSGKIAQGFRCPQQHGLHVVGLHADDKPLHAALAFRGRDGRSGGCVECQAQGSKSILYPILDHALSNNTGR